MPLKYQRTYGKKNATKSKNIHTPSITEFADNSSVEPTLFQERVGSPDFIGSDWNDTFDKLKSGSPPQTRSYKNSRGTNHNNESSFLYSSKTEISVAKEGIQSLTDNLKNVTQNSVISIRDSESEIGSLNVSVNKSLIKEHNASAISLSDMEQCRVKPKLVQTFGKYHENLSLQSNISWSIIECEESFDVADNNLNCINAHRLLRDEHSPCTPCGNNENAFPIMKNTTVPQYHSSPAKTEISLAKEGIQSLRDNLKNVTQNSIISIRDSESEIDILNVSVNKSLLKEHNASTISLSDMEQCRVKPKLVQTFGKSHENLSLQSNVSWSIIECEESFDDADKNLNCTNAHKLLREHSPCMPCGNNENALPIMKNTTVQITDTNKDTVISAIAVKPVTKLQSGKKYRRSFSGYIRNSKVLNAITTRLLLIDSKHKDVMNTNIDPGADRLSEISLNSSMEAAMNKRSADNMKPVAESSPLIHGSNIQKPLKHIEHMWRRGDFSPKRNANIIIQNSTADISKRLYFNEDKNVDLVVGKDNMMTSTDVETSSSLNEEKFRTKLSEIIESTSKPIIKLQSGKKWRRSLSTYIQNRSYDKGGSSAEAKLSLINEEPLGVNMNNLDPDFQNENFNDNIANLSIVDKDISYISISSDELDYSSKSNASHKSTAKSRSVFSNYNSRLSDIGTYKSSSASAYEVVLRRCGQAEPLPFDHCYSDIALQKCHKIGEGLFGEVFLYKDLITGECSVLKIIPIEGSLIVNGEKQKNFDEILAEIIIVMELSDLHCNSENATSGFCPLKKISCVKGKYPESLLDLWELYDEQHGSENDNPQMFGDDQLYIVLELGNAGAELESFRFTNAKQTLSVFRQIAFSLAVAERALEFEHRDLHWGNVLIVRTSEKAVSYKIDGRTFTVPLHGVKATIIDFSYSRITFNGQALFSDLGTEEELFSADGDYQFDIYRLMRQKNQNNWRSYQPYSNILWLHYLVDKMIEGVKYVNTKTKVHNISIVDLQFYKDSLLSYDKINAFVEDFNYFS